MYEVVALLDFMVPLSSTAVMDLVLGFSELVGPTQDIMGNHERCFDSRSQSSQQVQSFIFLKKKLNI